MIPIYYKMPTRIVFAWAKLVKIPELCNKIAKKDKFLLKFYQDAEHLLRIL